MNLQTLSSTWAWLAPAAANHIWQSTVFALAAGALTLLLRKNQARARYWLWLAASIKFLVPCALLMALGSFLAPPRAPAGMPSGYYYASEVTQPFAPLATPVIGQPSAQHLPLVELLPAAALLLWLVGFVGVLVSWFLRWRRVRAVARRAMPVNTGREVAALRWLERANKIRKPIPLRLSVESMEPGIFGLFRPVLLWPEGISAHLNDAHVEAILAHELRHVRYRDNLAAAMHALVQAIFWFHPLVWWMGARMVQERERGCDEEVIEMGSRPGAYAEGILKACEFCVASPLASFSGVTGADLKKRIVRVMSGTCGRRKLNFRAKLLLAAGGILAVALPLIFGLVDAQQSHAQTTPAAPAQLQVPASLSAPTTPVFEVDAIKPSKPKSGNSSLIFSQDGVVARNIPLMQLISTAYGIPTYYGLRRDLISGEPGWVDQARYDIDAKFGNSQARDLNKLPREQLNGQYESALQSLLAERFKLQVSRPTKDLPIYALVIAKGGPKLKAATPSNPYANGIKRPDGHPAGPGVMRIGPGSVTGQGIPIASLVAGLSQQLRRTIVDKTGLKSKYDITLKWAPDETQLPMFSGPGSAPGPVSALPPDTSDPSLFTAVEEQLGLKIESTKGPTKTLVIDHIERPSPN